MTFIKNNILRSLAAIIILLFTNFINITPDRPQTGFWAMEGTLVTHIFEDKTDSLSGSEIFELQDENGLPIWFGRYIFKDVCMTGVCKMIRLWLFWDAGGNYLGMQILENEPLTKSDHTEFKATDYEKLESILKDPSSILKDVDAEDLIIVPDSIDLYKAYEIDGFTGATIPILAAVVVKDAVYTCYTLWHTVYGSTQNAIYELQNDRINEEYLTKMFDSRKFDHVYWAINSVKKSPKFHEIFYPQIISCIKSNNSILSYQALNYFQPTLLSDTVIQNSLVQIIPEVKNNIKYEILWRLKSLDKVGNNVVLKLLKLFKEDKLGVEMLDLIFRLVDREHLNDNQEIVQILNSFSDHENRYVRNLTQKLLNEKNNPITAAASNYDTE